MLRTQNEAEVVEMLLMKSLAHDNTASGSQGKRYCAPLDLHVDAIGGRACPGKLRVLRTLSIVMDPYRLVMPCQSHLLLRNVIWLAPPLLILWSHLLLLHLPPFHWMIHSLPWVATLEVCGGTSLPILTLALQPACIIV